MDNATQEVALSSEAERLYLSYALSVIQSRALPDVRDGLKPVQRRILFTMLHELSLRPDAKPKKCAAIVGDVMGKYHPHGDSAIYEALVRMSQDWVLRAPLVYGHGNFGSLDGDEPAAMRYTEARLLPIAMELLSELPQKTVDYRPNYDGTKFEPVVLPARFPNLLVNGSQGIAVGMATSIPPHNLGEVLDASLALIDNESLTVRSLVKKIKGPDFPTGGEILNTPQEIAKIYKDGQGSIRLRGEWKLEKKRKGPATIIVTSIPYGLEKRNVVEKIADVIIGKKLPGLVDVRDESTQEVRIVLETKPGTNPDLVMAYLYKHTPLSVNIQLNLTCLVPTPDNPLVPAPQRLDLKSVLEHFLDFRFEVVTKRLQFELAQIEKRLHILEGFAAVFDALDEIIRIIRRSEGKKDAAAKIIKRFKLDEEQTDAILELKLYRLAKLEILLIRQELEEKQKEQKRLKALLRSEPKRWGIVADELQELRDKYADKRRTKFVKALDEEPEFSAEDFIVEQDGFVIVTAQGWVKRQQSVKDLTTTRTREGDEILACVAGSTKAPIGFFSSLGFCYVARFADIPLSTGYGDPIQKLFKLADGEKLVGALSFDKRFIEVPEPPDDGAPEPPYGVAVTKGGFAFLFSLRQHRDPSTRAGRRFARLKGGDEVLSVFYADDQEILLAASDDGHGIAVEIDDLPVLSGPGRGNMLIKLAGDAALIGVVALPTVRADKLVVFTEKGKKYELSAEGLLSARGARGKAVVKRSRFDRVLRQLPPIPEFSEK